MPQLSARAFRVVLMGAPSSGKSMGNCLTIAVRRPISTVRIVAAPGWGARAPAIAMRALSETLFSQHTGLGIWSPCSDLALSSLAPRAAGTDYPILGRLHLWKILVRLYLWEASRWKGAVLAGAVRPRRRYYHLTAAAGAGELALSPPASPLPDELNECTSHSDQGGWSAHIALDQQGQSRRRFQRSMVRHLRPGHQAPLQGSGCQYIGRQRADRLLPAANRARYTTGLRSGLWGLAAAENNEPHGGACLAWHGVSADHGRGPRQASIDRVAFDNGRLRRLHIANGSSCPRGHSGTAASRGGRSGQRPRTGAHP